MQATFFHLSAILPEDTAKTLLEGAIDRMYGAKSPQIVSANKAALAAAVSNLNKIQYPASWVNAEDNEASLKTLNPSGSKYSKPIDDFSAKFMKGIDSRSAENYPVSAFLPGGESPIGQSAFQKPPWLRRCLYGFQIHAHSATSALSCARMLLSAHSCWIKQN